MDTITRQNWQQHTTEPELTPDEHLSRRLMRHNFARQSGLFDYIQDHTQAERARSPASDPAEGWDRLVEWADGNRRTQRAELAAWGSWKLAQETLDMAPKEE